MSGSIHRIGWMLAGALCLGTLGASEARGQVLQLPSYGYFSIRTTILAPDSGRGFAGGVSRFRQGATSRGLPIAGRVPGWGRLGKNRAIGGGGSAGGVSVGATIIDHAAMDRALLAEAAARRGERPETVGPAAITHSSSDDKLESLAQIRAHHQAKDAHDQQQFRQWIAQARQAEQDGKWGAAKVMYRMAAKYADESQRRELARHVTRQEAALTKPKPASHAPASTRSQR